jgi:hypothetical protein
MADAEALHRCTQATPERHADNKQQVLHPRDLDKGPIPRQCNASVLLSDQLKPVPTGQYCCSATKAGLTPGTRQPHLEGDGQCYTASTEAQQGQCFHV